jgi:hypothetical protein
MTSRSSTHASSCTVALPIILDVLALLLLASEPYRDPVERLLWAPWVALPIMVVAGIVYFVRDGDE